MGTVKDGEPLGRRESQRQRDLMRAEEVADAAEPLAVPGHMFTEDWLAEQFDLGPLPDDGDEREKWRWRYMSLVDKWRDALGARHIPTESTHRGAYVVLAPEEAVTVYEHHAFRELRKAVATGIERLGQWIDPDGLAPDYRQRRIDGMGRIALVEHAIRTARAKPPKMPAMRVLPPAETNGDPAS